MRSSPAMSGEKSGLYSIPKVESRNSKAKGLRRIMNAVIKFKRHSSPTITPQALAWDRHHLWVSSRDLGMLYKIDIGAEICGHTFVDGAMHVLRGKEKPNEDWRIARLDPQEETPQVKDIAVVPFACRSLTFDGELFWSNYRAKDTVISFALPN